MKKVAILVIAAVLLVLAARVAAQEPTRIIIVNGQSNAGRLGKGTYSVPGVAYYSPQATGSGAWVPLASTKGYHGVEIPLLARLSELCPERRFAVVQVWANATPISEWKPPTGRQFRRLNNVVQAAGGRLSGEPVVAGFAWLQNERDSRDPLLAARYGSAMTTLVAAWRDHFAADLPFALMGPHTFMASGGAIVNDGLAALDAADENAAVAYTLDLTTNDDGVHFNSAGLFTLGGRMADSLYAMGACD